MNQKEKFVMLAHYYANTFDILHGILKLEDFQPTIQSLEAKGYLVDGKIAPKHLSMIQAMTRIGDDPMKMREDLLLINLSRTLDRLLQDNIKLTEDLIHKINRI